MVGGILSERTVKDVLPKLESNRIQVWIDIIFYFFLQEHFHFVLNNSFANFPLNIMHGTEYNIEYYFPSLGFSNL